MSGAQNEAEEPVPEFPEANIVAVRSMVDALRSTLGPLSNDKLVVNALASRTPKQDFRENNPVDDYTVANDGATILQELPTEHPIAPVVLRLIGPERPGETDVVGQDIYDGVSTTVVLTGALLDEAESLLEQGIHPYDVRRGYAAAAEAARERLAELSTPLSAFDDPDGAAVSVARTAMTGNDVGGVADRWSRLAADAVDVVGMPNETSFVVRQISTGRIEDSRLVHGAVLDMNHRMNERMPKRLEDATVLCLDGHETGGLMDRDLDIEGARMDLSSLDDLDEVESMEAARRRRIVDGYADLGVDVVCTRLGINDAFEELLTERGMVGIRRVNRLDLKQLAYATGATLVKNPEDVTAADLGRAGVVEEVRREPRRHRRKNRYMTVFDDCGGDRSVVMLLHGVTEQLADQATTEVRKAAKAVATVRGEAGAVPGVVAGAGATEVELAAAARERARGIDSRAQLAADAFGDALESVVAALVRNAGGDPIDAVADLRAAHADGDERAGYLVFDDAYGDAVAAGVLDPAAYKRSAVTSATEVADTILRVDDAVDATFTEEPADEGDAIYDDRAEKHMDYLDENEGTRWD
jgi:chaperonin GroEL (HSP60 family)